MSESGAELSAYFDAAGNPVVLTGSSAFIVEIGVLKDRLLERDAEIERLQATLEAIDDHGRAGSFVETLKAKDKLITELADALQSHIRVGSPNWPAAVELINRAREVTKK